ncbi:MAG TPA: flagellar biosynthetic protein FliO [Candidatus Atribacteria bacterium]|nr:flagellar biosynthetic protein FliO [Candidatus Atribacteria bacterium]
MKNFYKFLVFLNFMTMARGELFAQEEELNLPEIQPPAFSGDGGSILRFIGAFLLVVAILWGFYYLMKKLAGQNPRLSSSQYMKLVDFLNLKPNFSLYLVEVGERVVMIAQSGNAIREITEFSKDELEENASFEGFSGYLDSWFGRKKEKKDG